jgi:hypothetical protein
MKKRRRVRKRQDRGRKRGRETEGRYREGIGPEGADALSDKCQKIKTNDK